VNIRNKMRASNKRLTLLSEAEQAALYEIPDFDDDQRLEYLTLSDGEQQLVNSRKSISAKVYCILQIGYFKAVKMVFRFDWEDILQDDIDFILQQYFSEQQFDKEVITKYEHYTQCETIVRLFDYRMWSKDYEQLLYDRAIQIISRDVNPQFITIELLSFLQKQKIIRPQYSVLQIVVSDVLTTERTRLHNLINKTLTLEMKSEFEKLLLENSTITKLATLKQDAKNFKARIMAAERDKLLAIQPLYQIAKVVLPKLKLSQQNIHYYASLAEYYTIHELRDRLKSEQTHLYLLCYIWRRYQQIDDVLVTAFCYQIKHFNNEIKEKARDEFAQHAVNQQKEWTTIKKLAYFYVDEQISDEAQFGEVREKVFAIVPKDELSKKVGIKSKKSQREVDFRWKTIDKIGRKLRLHLRPIAMALEFSSTIQHNPWIEALNWFKEVFSKQKTLTLDDCPENTIPRCMEQFLLKTDDKKQVTLQAGRYEFWVYRQILKRVESGELYLNDSINHRSLNDELVSLAEKDKALKQLNIPALIKPIAEQLDEKFAELHKLWIIFNKDLRKGKLKHLNYDEKNDTLHLKKLKKDDAEEVQFNFYQQLPLSDIVDVLRFVHNDCRFLSVFTHIQPRYAKHEANIDSLIAGLIAQAMNNGNLNMAEISDIPYDLLQDTLQSRIRLSTLKASNDILSNRIANMPIFEFYSFDLEVLYGGVDGQKFEVETPTTKARNSKKYFKKGKGVVAYTMLANHIPLQVELIGANEHESYFVFDIWYNNTSNIVPDVVTGDMHCVNKANFAIMDWFGCKLFPRFTNLDAQRKNLCTGNNLSDYEKCLIKPKEQINRQLIEDEWSNLQRIIATLGLKETTQSNIIKKLCTYSANSTHKALFEYDKLVRSIHTLKYFLDPKIQRDTHYSQNRIEAYHQLRSMIAQAYGRKQLIGRTDTAIEISNQCGRLIANVIIYCNSIILSKLLEKYRAEDNQKALAILKKISPVAWRHIHFMGHFKFSDQNSIDLDAIINKLILKFDGVLDD